MQMRPASTAMPDVTPNKVGRSDPRLAISGRTVSVQLTDGSELRFVGITDLHSPGVQNCFFVGL